MTQPTLASCMCAVCQEQCTHKPGWFKPGEAEKVAEFLRIDLQELFDQYLMPDSWELPRDSIRTLSPAIKGKKPGQRLAYAAGECVFFKEGRCTIHPVKPYECLHATHSPDGTDPHEEVALSWADHQEQIETLQDNFLG